MRPGFDRPLRVITLCSGYDSQCMALERLKAAFPGFDYELVAWSEIDRHAIQAHDAVFPQWAGRNLGDMTKIDWSRVEGDIDLLVYSTPCTSISTAGRQEGLKKGSGTASSILWATEDAIRVLRPRWLLMENVKALVSKKFKADFDEWQRLVASYGYANCWKVLNAKDYGVPQNRERVFLVSHLGDELYHFPEPFPLAKTLDDILEDEVDDGFYLSEKQVEHIFAYLGRKQQEGCGFKPNMHHCGGGGISTTIVAGYNKYYDRQMILERRKMGMKRTLPVGYNGRVAKEQGEPDAVPRPPLRELRSRGKIVEFFDAYNGISRRGVAGTITTRVDKSNKTFIIEKMTDMRKERAILSQERTEYAKRIRDGYEKGCVHARRSELKRLVPRTDGISNTLTSVQKDNLLFEKKVLSYSRDEKGRIVSRHARAIANTVHTKEGSCGNTAQFVVEPRIEQVGNLVAEKGKFDNPIRAGRSFGIYDNTKGVFMHPPLADIARTLKADCHNGVIDGFAVRKLTPRECFRLMDVSDVDIDRIQASGVSKSQQYRMAGNSIVVAVLFHIFRKMFVDTGSDNGELELF